MERSSSHILIKGRKTFFLESSSKEKRNLLEEKSNYDIYKKVRKGEPKKKKDKKPKRVCKLHFYKGVHFLRSIDFHMGDVRGRVGEIEILTVWKI